MLRNKHTQNSPNLNPFNQPDSALLDCILSLIQQDPQGIAEHQLLKTLAAQGYDSFSPSLEPLALFQAHFLLFHLLYRQQDEWFHQGHGWLEINCLNIRFQPASASPLSDSTQAVEKDDPLRRYYLDFEHYRQTQTEEVVALLDQFWTRLCASEPAQVLEARVILELSNDQPLSLEVIERQFRQLSQRHHPDRGGKKQDFQQLTQARAVLKKAL